MNRWGKISQPVVDFHEWPRDPPPPVLRTGRRRRSLSKRAQLTTDKICEGPGKSQSRTRIRLHAKMDIHHCTMNGLSIYVRRFQRKHRFANKQWFQHHTRFGLKIKRHYEKFCAKEGLQKEWEKRALHWEQGNLKRNPCLKLDDLSAMEKCKEQQTTKKVCKKKFAKYGSLTWTTKPHRKAPS